MSIAAISSSIVPPASQNSSSTSASPAPETSWQAYVKERRSDMQTLSSDIKSGNLQGAQQEYQDLVTLGQQLDGRGNGTPFLRSDRQLDFNAIGGALQNGNLAGAEQALTALQNTFGNGHNPVTTGTPSTTAGNSTPAASSIDTIA